MHRFFPKLKIFTSEIDGTAEILQKVTATSGLTTFFSALFAWLSENGEGIASIVALISLVIMILSFLRNRWYVKMKNKREQEMHDIDVQIKQRRLEERDH